MGLWEVFQEGGFIMWPLLIFSVASWFVIIEKIMTLKKFTEIFKTLFDQAEGHLKSNEMSKVRDLCLKAGSQTITAPVMVYLEDTEISQEQKDQKAQRRIDDVNRSLRRYLWVLGTVSSSAPFIGLFGTVVGIMRSFDSIAQAGKGGFSVVAAGISEALIATAAGILVAVIAVIFFNVFQTQLNLNMAEYRNRLDDLKDYLVKE